MHLYGLVFLHRLLGDVVSREVGSVRTHGYVYSFPEDMLAAATVSVELQQVGRFGNVQADVIPQLKILRTQ